MDRNKKQPDFLQKSIEYQNTNKFYSDIVIVQSRVISIFITLIISVLLIVIFLLSSTTFSKKVNIIGEIRYDKGVIRMFPNSSGIILNSYIKNGEKVKKNDILFSVSTRKDNKQTSTAKLLLNELTLDKKLIKNIINDKEKIITLKKSTMENQSLILNSIINELENKLDTMKKILVLSDNNITQLINLKKKKLISLIDYEEQLRKHLEKKVNISNVNNEINQRKNELLRLKHDIKVLNSEKNVEINNLKRNLIALNEKYVNIKKDEEFYIKSPINGTVSEITTYEGSPANPKNSLVKIVPDNSKFQAILYVPPSLIGLVKTGQKVLIKYNSFPYQRYGVYKGKISSISNTLTTKEDKYSLREDVQQYYLAIVTLEYQKVFYKDKNFSLFDGMKINATVLLEERTVYNFFM